MTPEDLGKLRQNAHLSNSTPRFFKDPNTENIRGALGELEFSRTYGFPIDIVARPSGDKGIDFSTPMGIINVKTARFPRWLLVKVSERDKLTVIYILAKDIGKGMATLLGWEYASVMVTCPTGDKGGYGIVSYYKEASMLQPMGLFSSLLLESGRKLRLL